MISCLRPLSLAVATIALQSIVVMPSDAAPPDGVTFFPEIAGYAGENPYLDKPEWHASMDVDVDSDLWVCSNGYVFEYHDGEWIDHTDASGGGEYVSITSEGAVWVASSAHLASYDGSEWEDHSEGIPEKIRALSAEGDDVWFAYYDNGDDYLGHYNGGIVTRYQEGLLQNYIQRLTATSGGVWIVYNNFYDIIDCDGSNCPKGTSYFDGVTFQHYSIVNGLPRIGDSEFTNVPWIVISENDIYAICNSKLVSFASGQWSVITTASSYRVLVSDEDGTLWHGYLGGGTGRTVESAALSYLHDNSWVSFNMDSIRTWLYDELVNGEYSYQRTNSLAVTGEGIVWFGISAGLVRIDTNQLSLLTPVGIETDMPAAESPVIVCYPNPFNNTTTIHFQLPETAQVEADIYSITGQHVRRLSNGWLPAGEHTFQWDGRNSAGTVVSSGMYFVSIRAGDMRLVGSMTFMK